MAHVQKWRDWETVKLQKLIISVPTQTETWGKKKRPLNTLPPLDLLLWACGVYALLDSYSSYREEKLQEYKWSFLENEDGYGWEDKKIVEVIIDKFNASHGKEPWEYDEI